MRLPAALSGNSGKCPKCHKDVLVVGEQSVASSIQQTTQPMPTQPQVPPQQVVQQPIPPSAPPQQQYQQAPQQPVAPIQQQYQQTPVNVVSQATMAETLHSTQQPVAEVPIGILTTDTAPTSASVRRRVRNSNRRTQTLPIFLMGGAAVLMIGALVVLFTLPKEQAGTVPENEENSANATVADSEGSSAPSSQAIAKVEKVDSPEDAVNIILQAFERSEKSVEDGVTAIKPLLTFAPKEDDLPKMVSYFSGGQAVDDEESAVEEIRDAMGEFRENLIGAWRDYFKEYANAISWDKAEVLVVVAIRKYDERAPKQFIEPYHVVAFLQADGGIYRLDIDDTLKWPGNIWVGDDCYLGTLDKKRSWDEEIIKDLISRQDSKLTTLINTLERLPDRN